MPRSDLGSSTDAIAQPKSWGHLSVALLFLAAFGWIVWESLTFPRLARIFPLLMGILGLAVGGMQVAVELRNRRAAARRASHGPEGTVPAEPPIARQLVPIGWLGSYFLSVAVLGFLAGSGAYVFVALLFSAKLHWLRALLGAVAIVTFVYLLVRFLGLELPPSLLWL